MTAPIPLTDPSGTVRAWACGKCGVVATSGGEPMFMPSPDYLTEDAARARTRAVECCVCDECGGPNPRGTSWRTRCVACAALKAEAARENAFGDIFCACGSRLDDGSVCEWCTWNLGVLAAIGMAVAARAYGDARAWKAADAVTRSYEADRRSWPIRNTAAADPGLAENRDTSLAALCGVGVETVRRWK